MASFELEQIENAKQAMSETHSSWESRCHAIMAALGVNYGRLDEFLPDEDKDVAPADAFAAWLREGPKLAKAAGCHVGIKVTEAKP